VDRRRRWEALVGRRARELLDHVPEVVLVDVVDRRLMLLDLRLWLLLWLVVIVMIIKILTLIVGIKRGFFDDGLGDLVGELVEVSEVLVSAGIITSSGSATTRSGWGRICRGLTAFIHHPTTLRHRHRHRRPLSLSLSI
jgi:hypothetical protein